MASPSVAGPSLTSLRELSVQVRESGLLSREQVLPQAAPPHPPSRLSVPPPGMNRNFPRLKKVCIQRETQVLWCFATQEWVLRPAAAASPGSSGAPDLCRHRVSRAFPPACGWQCANALLPGAVSSPVGKITTNFIEFLEPPPSPTGLLKTKPAGEGAAVSASTGRPRGSEAHELGTHWQLVS